MSGFVKMFFTALLLRELKCSPLMLNSSISEPGAQTGTRDLVKCYIYFAFLTCCSLELSLLSLTSFTFSFCCHRKLLLKGLFPPNPDALFACRVTCLEAALVCGVSGSMLGFLSISVLCCMLITSAAAASSHRWCCKCMLCCCRHHNTKHLGLL